MGISGISNPSSYEELQLLQAQKEKAQTDSAKTGAAEAAQIEAIGNEVNGQTQDTRTVSSDRMDTIEISSEGRAFQESQTVSKNKPAPSAKPASQAGESDKAPEAELDKNLQELVE